MIVKLHLEETGGEVMDYFNMKKQFSAYSAIFNNVPSSTFVRAGISTKVKRLFPDENGVNLPINNEKRLKESAYVNIRDMYNERIKHHNLSLKELPYRPYDDMIEIVKFQLKDDKDDSSSGYYATYPRTFYCEECGHYISFGSDSEFENFNPKK